MVSVDFLLDQGTPAHQRGCPGSQRRGLLEVALGDGPDQAQAGPGRQHESHDLQGHRDTQRTRDGRDGGRHRDQPKGECHGQQLDNAEHGRQDQPDDPGHGRSAQLRSYSGDSAPNRPPKPRRAAQALLRG